MRRPDNMTSARSAESVRVTLSDGPSTSDGPVWVLLPVQAKVRGFRNTLAFRRWCRSHGVPIHKDGRREWIGVADVDRAIGMLAGGADPIVAAARAAVRRFVTGKE